MESTRVEAQGSESRRHRRTHENVSFLGVRIETLAGQISEFHVGLKGTMAALYLKAARAQKAITGQATLRIQDGQDRGRRVLNKAEAAVVLRILTEYVAGGSPLQIVRARRCHLLHAGGQVGRLPDRRAIHAQIGADGADHHLAGVEPHADPDG